MPQGRGGAETQGPDLRTGLSAGGPPEDAPHQQPGLSRRATPPLISCTKAGGQQGSVQRLCGWKASVQDRQGTALPSPALAAQGPGAWSIRFRGRALRGKAPRPRAGQREGRTLGTPAQDGGPGPPPPGALASDTACDSLSGQALRRLGTKAQHLMGTWGSQYLPLGQEPRDVAAQHPAGGQ